MNWILVVGFGLDTVITEAGLSVAAVEVPSGVAVVGAAFEVSAADVVAGTAVSDRVGLAGVVTVALVAAWVVAWVDGVVPGQTLIVGADCAAV